MKTMTIGFTGKSAKKFFDLLKSAHVKTLLDVRISNTSQLSGYSKRDDLEYFLMEIAQIKYIEVKELAPSKAILSPYQKSEISWEKYEDLYLNEISRRLVERQLDPVAFDESCLLCSEHKPHLCHRRLAIEYLNEKWGNNIDIIHLM